MGVIVAIRPEADEAAGGIATGLTEPRQCGCHPAAAPQVVRGTSC